MTRWRGMAALPAGAIPQCQHPAQRRCRGIDASCTGPRKHDYASLVAQCSIPSALYFSISDDILRHIDAIRQCLALFRTWAGRPPSGGPCDDCLVRSLSHSAARKSDAGVAAQAQAMASTGRTLRQICRRLRWIDRLRARRQRRAGNVAYVPRHQEHARQHPVGEGDCGRPPGRSIHFRDHARDQLGDARKLGHDRATARGLCTAPPAGPVA